MCSLQFACNLSLSIRSRGLHAQHSAGHREPETAEPWKRFFPSAFGEPRPEGFSY